jgi:hypothetical protein
MRALAMEFLGENAPMLRIARKLGMTIVGRGAEFLARLEFPGRNRRLGPAVRNQFAWALLRSPSRLVH